MCNEEKRERGKKGKGELDDLIYEVIGCMIEVHKELGPGFIEKVYRRAVEIEFRRHGFEFESEKRISLEYRGEKIGIHRLDLFVQDELIIELKTVETLVKKHYAQVRSYLKATKKPVGLLVNFADYQL